MTEAPVRSPEPSKESERRLLVAADGPQRARIKDALRDVQGLRVREAATSLDALEVILASEADLCIADADDTLLGGLDLLHLALAAPGGAGLPILILAAPGARLTRSDALAAGAWDCLLKPLEPEVILDRVELTLDSLRSAQAARPASPMLSRVLFADPDPAYLQYAVRALSGVGRLETAATAPEAAVKILRDKPALAVLARSFHPALRRILDSRPDDFRDVCRILALDDAGDGPDVIPRSLDRDALVQRVSRALAVTLPGPTSDGDELAALPAVLSAAVERFFTVMAGEPARPADGEPSPEARAWIELKLRRVDDEPLLLRVEIQCPLEMRSRLAAAVYGGAAPVTEEDEQSVLGEVVNVAAGRLKAFCWEQRLDVEVGLPRWGAESLERSPRVDPYWRGSFRWAGQTCAIECSTV